MSEIPFDSMVAGKRCRMSDQYIMQATRYSDQRNRARKRGVIVSTNSFSLTIRVKWDDYSQVVSYGCLCLEIIHSKENLAVRAAGGAKDLGNAVG